MKNPKTPFTRRNHFPIVMTFVIVLLCSLASAQAPQTVFVRLIFQKVAAGQEQEYEKIIKENIKPMHQLRKQSGKIINWRLFKIHYTGDNNEYNYVGVSYYDSWAKTEPNENWPELLKNANPKADMAAISTKFRSIRTITGEALYTRVEFAAGKTPSPFKYIIVDFMKVKPGMGEEYLKVEKEDWKPFHQVLIDENKMSSWGLWERSFPGGSGSNHDYVTTNAYTTYAQIGSVNYEDTFKKANPTKDVQASFDRATKARDNVRSELWELIDALQ